MNSIKKETLLVGYGIKTDKTMKKIMYMAVAAIAVLSSCSSDNFAEDGNNGDAKVFTGIIESDGATTRTTLDATSKKAFWENTDVISINGVGYQAQSGGAATTTFTKDELYFSEYEAPEPPYYAFYANGQSRGEMSYKATGIFTLPRYYYLEDGKFNMPMYAYSASSTELSFKNLCGVLAITVPSTKMSSVSSVAVLSDHQMNGDFTATPAGVLTFESKELTDNDKMVVLSCTGEGDQVSIEEGSSKTFYIPVPGGSHILTVYVSNGTTVKSMTTSTSVLVERNTIYNVDFVGSGDCKESVDLGLDSGVLWATCNVGASQPQEFGDYFAWGETTPYYTSQDPLSWKDSKTDGYCWDSYCGVSSFTEWEPAPYDGDVLETSYDAAAVNWGGNWRMPTIDDFEELLYSCYVEWTDDYNGVSGLIVYATDEHRGYFRNGDTWKLYDGSSYSAASQPIDWTDYTPESDTHIFLPAAKYMNGTNLVGSPALPTRYWSSTIVDPENNPQNAFCLQFSKGSIAISDNGLYRYYGFSVRPVCQ